MDQPKDSLYTGQVAWAARRLCCSLLRPLAVSGTGPYPESLPLLRSVPMESLMVPLTALIVPSLLCAVLVFIGSSIIHMVLKYHASDYSQIPNEDAVRAAMRAGNPAPKKYIVPWCPDMKAMQSEEMKRKFEEGPNAIIYLGKPGMPTMGPTFVQWFVFTFVISLVVGYLCAAVLPRGTSYLKVFQVAGTAGWLAYGGAAVIPSIWMRKPWAITWKEVFDALIYGLLTAGTYGWLWPR